MLLLSFGVGASTSRLIAAIGPHIPGLCIHLVGCGSGKEYTLAGAMVISAIALTFLGGGLPALAGWWCGYSLAVALLKRDSAPSTTSTAAHGAWPSRWSPCCSWSGR